MDEMLSYLLLIISFSLIVFLISRKKNFGASMIAGSIIFALSMPDKILDVLITTITDAKVIALMIIVVLIKLLATLLQQSGLLKDFIDWLEGKLSTRGLLISIPSLLGMLPVPGGALLSAPMVEEQGRKAGMSNERMMFVNLWYRHIWFMIFPLSTSLILIADMSGINIYRLIYLQIPAFLVAFFLGYIFVHRYKSRSKDNGGDVKGIIPVIVPISMAVPLSFFISTYAAYLIALPVGIIVSIIMSDKKPDIKKGISPSLALAIFGIMFFKNTIIASGIAKTLPAHFTFLPAYILIAVLSFAIGLLTAHNMAAIGILYPMFSTIMNENLVILLFITSFMGYLISPLHLCLAVTYEYFKPNFAKLYKMMLPAAIFMVFVAVVFYGLELI
ncbi:MAG: DUF401 family protein [Thermoplasmata archaeon]|nr:DUF401 family protein [Thermoplasmata archaeon]